MAQQEPRETAGDLLKRYRLASGLTQEELAQRSQVSARTIGSIERGALQRPRSESLRLLAAALDLSPEQYEVVLAAVRRQHVGDDKLTGSLAIEGASAATRYLLPIPPTPLIGREREVTQAQDLLRRAEVRLLTLYGPPGVGKTRLALQIAFDMRHEFADGAVFVALAPLREPAQVMAAIAQAVGLREHGAQPLETALQSFLAGKQFLLMLDNCEQALAAGPEIGHLLGMSPRVKALATSREVLRVRGEHEVRVPPLALVDLAHLPPLYDLGRYAAVDLFVQRARAVKPAFTLTEENGRAVAEICARLDGLPLAIELAAARVKVLPPDALLARLDHRLRLLTHDMRDLPERHHTLRDAVAWSYELLSDEEQQLFAQLAVFSGGWTLEAAEAICAAHGEHGPEPVDLLTALADKSLIQQADTSAGEPRFSLLETIRAYALEQLALQRDVEAIRQRHAGYYVRWAEDAEPHFTGPRQAHWFARTAREQGNLRAALEWAVEHAADWRSSPGLSETRAVDDALALGLRLAGALGVYWSVRGPLREERAGLEELLSLAAARAQQAGDPADDSDRQIVAVRAKALRMAAQLAEHDYNFTQASSWLEESLRLYRLVGDRESEAAALNRLGIATLDAGHYAQAEQWFERCLAVRRETGDVTGMAGALTNMGVIALHLGAYELAASRLAEALACYPNAGYVTASGQVETPTVSVANVFANLGAVSYHVGDYDRATQLLEQSLDSFKQLGFGAGIAIAKHYLGNVRRERGDTASAVSLYMQSLDIFRANPHPQGIVQCLEELARLAHIRGQMEPAARLWGAVEGLRGSIPGLQRLPGLRAQYERDVAALRSVLGDETFEAAWASGRSLSLERAITYAREISTLSGEALRSDALHVAG